MQIKRRKNYLYPLGILFLFAQLAGCAYYKAGNEKVLFVGADFGAYTSNETVQNQSSLLPGVGVGNAASGSRSIQQDISDEQPYIQMANGAIIRGHISSSTPLREIGNAIKNILLIDRVASVWKKLITEQPYAN